MPKKFAHPKQPETRHVSVLKSRMSRDRWSVSSLSRQSGVSRASLVAILAGRDTTLSRLKLLADSLGLTFKDLFAESVTAPEPLKTDAPKTTASEMEIVKSIIDSQTALLDMIRRR